MRLSALFVPLLLIFSIGCDPATPETNTRLIPAVNEPVENSPTVGELAAQLPLDAARPHLTVFVSDAQAAKSHPVVQWFHNDPELASLRQRMHFQVYHPGMAMFDRLWKGRIDVSPAVCIQNAERQGYGQVVFLAKGSAVGSSPAELKRKIAATLRVDTRVGRLQCLCQNRSFPIDDRTPSQPYLQSVEPPLASPLPDLFVQPDLPVDPLGPLDDPYLYDEPLYDDTAAFFGLLLLALALAAGVTVFMKYREKKATYRSAMG